MTPLHYELTGGDKDLAVMQTVSPQVIIQVMHSEPAGDAKLTVAIASAENLPFAHLPEADTDIEGDTTVLCLDGVPFGSWLKVGVVAEGASGTITGINVNRQQSLKAL